ncbi:MAG: coenzyme F420-0:L-glutamate ligase [Proteobacteria bacterium]|nr:coenzyme F420-0:L-glutamate ligase [Pseudomonadota bacterium]
MKSSLTIHPLKNIPLIEAGDNLADLIVEALRDAGIEPVDGDILVLAQKIVSKAEGRQVLLAAIDPSAEAVKLARETDKDPRLVELILRESSAVIRTAPGVIIVRHRLGIVSANAGIDQSNINHAKGESALLLPENPDRSALRLREALQQEFGKNLGVIVSDSMNRPWRLGTVGYAIGSAGVTVLEDRRGDTDIFGRELQVTVSNLADAIATAAMLVMGETSERVPAALVRGLSVADSTQAARDSIRPVAEDLFL